MLFLICKDRALGVSQIPVYTIEYCSTIEYSVYNLDEQHSYIDQCEYNILTRIQSTIQTKGCNGSLVNLLQLIVGCFHSLVVF